MKANEKINPKTGQQIEEILELIFKLREGESIKIPLTSYNRLFMHKIIKGKLSLLFLEGHTQLGNIIITVPRPERGQYFLVLKYASYKKYRKLGMIKEVRILDLFRSGFSPVQILSAMEDRLMPEDKELIYALLDSPLMTRKK